MHSINSIVSIIVPIYNMEDYLQQCIDSICKQTYDNLEIILVDDGSLDKSGSICEENARKDSRIKVIHKENGGLSSARNIGIDIATGDYIAFVDADDMVHAKFVEILIELCIHYSADISQCDFLMVAKNPSKLSLNPQQTIQIFNSRQAIFKLCCTDVSVKYIVAWNKLYKKDLFENIRYPIGRIHEDEFTTYLLLWKANRVVVTNQYLYYYLQRENSIMGKPFSIERLDILDAYRGRLKFLKSNNFKEEYSKTLEALLYWIKRNYALVQENYTDNEDICLQLLLEKESVEKEINNLADQNKKMIQCCEYPKQAKIVLYGAGKWGRIYYKWIKENQQGNIVGWVDNNWARLEGINYNVKPIDFVLNVDFDYILITIKDILLQEEVRENLVQWGIQKEKIIAINMIE